MSNESRNIQLPTYQSVHWVLTPPPRLPVGQVAAAGCNCRIRVRNRSGDSREHVLICTSQRKELPPHKRVSVRVERRKHANDSFVSSPALPFRFGQRKVVAWMHVPDESVYDLRAAPLRVIGVSVLHVEDVRDVPACSISCRSGTRCNIEKVVWHDFTTSPKAPIAISYP